MATQPAPITFVISGQALPAGQASTALNGTVKAAVRVGARRGGGESVRVTARPGEDIVLLHIANGPTLYLHPEDARELLRAQKGALPATGRDSGKLPPPDAEVKVPPQLGWRSLDEATPTRSRLTDWIGEVSLDAVEVVTGMVKESALDLASAVVTKMLDSQVDSGVYLLSPKSLPRLKDEGKKLSQVPAAPNAGDPILVFIHGTFIDTSITFGKLWQQHPARVEALFRHYGGRVYALEHPTLSVNPLGNALALVRALPKGARLHLITHSRGGLVAEVLARICGGQGLREEDKALFKGECYQQHRADLRELESEIKNKGLRVERLVRVACPARGTLLASRRLDAYLSVFKWGLDIAGVPVLAELVDFLAEVARRRGRPDELPGLEAMMPGRPLATWLNAPADPVPGDLRVVAGDVEGDSVLSWLKTLLSDAFYWADNDLVVQTRSMYGGTPRAGGAATFLLDRGGKVTHFNYFSNERTVDAITRALVQDQPAEFRTIGPLSWTGEDASGTRAARALHPSGDASTAERPAVFVLPGILGSHLKVDGKRVWLSLRFFNNLDRLKWDPQNVARVEADGPVGMSYADLVDHLAGTHEVIPFGFDWRRPIEDEARRLADAVDTALAARNATQQPVRIVAHSMGGILARTMQLERPQTWERMMSRPGARVLMLGTPNGGSFAPMQVMSGDDAFGNLLSVFGCLFDGHGARKLIAEMPGLVQLQAGLVNGAHDLDTTAGWQRLADVDIAAVKQRLSERAWWHSDEMQLEPFRWGVPTQSALDRAVTLRKRLDQQRDTLGADAAKMLLVVGKAPFTPADVDIAAGGVIYLDTPDDGDGRVTFSSACLPGVKTWRVDVVHGDLADAKEAFDAYVELLQRGDTARLPLAAALGATRGVAADGRPPGMVPSRPARALRGSTPPAVLRDVFAAIEEGAPEQRSAATRLHVTVVNGNLKFVRPALMLGHYQSLRLTGTEWVIDRMLDQSLSEGLRAGLYPASIGTNQVFTNTRRNPDDPFVLPRPEAAIVVGLGEEGSLRMSNLVETVRQGVLAYAQRVGESGGGGSTTFELAATLIGSGGSSMSAGTAAQAIAIGVREANQRLAQVSWPQVARLQLIELYLDRASEALRALSALGETQAQDLVLENHVQAGLGGLPRPADSGYRGADYDFISVQQRDAMLEFALDTRRARNEVRGAMQQSKLVDELVRAGASETNDDPRIGRSLFKLLVPIEIEPFLSGSSSVVMQLDTTTAVYPWELLDPQRMELDRRDDTRPWSIRTRLLRKLRTKDFRVEPLDSGREAGALVIGEPLCPDLYPPLPGAAAEAAAVAEVLGTRPILQADALSVVNAVLDRPYRILHVAGHGDFIDGTGGVVLCNGTTFGPREVKAMRAVPQLAFINCCHLGRFDREPLKAVNPLGGRLPEFAANVAEELIRIGVRCVVAAGWAVDDEPAKLFARSFYEALTRGRPFVEAVANARETTWRRHPQSNTWAAYQCYGDPDWTFVAAEQNVQGAMPRPPDVPSADSLALRLHALAQAHAYDDRAQESIRPELEHLESAYRSRWGSDGAVAGAFGAVYAEIGDFDHAIDWYQRALNAEDGAVTLRVMEQLANVRARRGAKFDDLARARAEIGAAIDLLARVTAVAPTVERESLLGSAYKRLAMVEARARRGAAGQAALAKARDHYRVAEDIARRTHADNLYYPAMNRMSIALVLSAGAPAPAGFEAVQVSAVRQSLQAKNTQNPDFWSVAGVTELRIYEALAGQRLAQALDGIRGDLRDLKVRMSSTQKWQTVADQACFTLTPYLNARRVPAAERDAARALIAILREGNGEEKQAPKPARPRRAKAKAPPGQTRRARRTAQ